MLEIARTVLPPQKSLRAEITPVIEQSDTQVSQDTSYIDIVNNVLDTIGVSDNAFGAYIGHGRQNLIKYPVLYRCIDIIESIIASLDYYIVDPEGQVVKTSELKRSRSDTKRTVQAFIDVMLDKPDGNTLFSDLIRQTAGDMCFDGNAYWTFKLDRMGDLMFAEMAGSSNAVIDYASDGTKLYRLQSITEGYRTFLAENVIHIVKNRMRPMYASVNTATRSFTHEFGIGPVYACSNATRTGITSDNYVAEFFNTNFASTVVLSSEKKLTSDQLTYLESRMLNNKKTRRPLILSGGFDVKNINNEPQGDNVDKLRDFQVNDVARAFGLPPPLVGQHISQWGSGLESLFRMTINWCIRFYTSAISQHLSTLLPKGYALTFNAEELKKGDYESLALILEKGMPYMTRDEGRRMLGLPGEGKNFPENPLDNNQAENNSGMQD